MKKIIYTSTHKERDCFHCYFADVCNNYNSEEPYNAYCDEFEEHNSKIGNITKPINLGVFICD